MLEFFKSIFNGLKAIALGILYGIGFTDESINIIENSLIVVGILLGIIYIIYKIFELKCFYQNK